MTRVSSRRAPLQSNQWKACPATTMSTQESGSVVSSARPATLWKPGWGASTSSAASRISWFGSTA
jgi:hypothetical protein